MNTRSVTPDDDLDALLAESLDAASESKRVATARRRLATERLGADDRAALAAQVERWDEARVWTTIANVALVHCQACLSCNAHSEMFMGWMKEQVHRVNVGTRRLVAGHAVGAFPLRIERHVQKPVEVCPHCLPAYIAAHQALIKVEP